MRDSGSKGKKKIAPIVAMAVMVNASEPFYKDKKKKSKEKLLTFGDIKDYVSIRDKILDYAKTRGIEVEKMQMLWSDYATNEPMTGFDVLEDSDEE